MLRLFQEEFDIREQARWKLERAIEMAVAAKRWDAAAVSSFALGDLVGGDDSAAAVGALMLHQARYSFCVGGESFMQHVGWNLVHIVLGNAFLSLRRRVANTLIGVCHTCYYVGSVFSQVGHRRIEP